MFEEGESELKPLDAAGSSFGQTETRGGISPVAVGNRTPKGAEEGSNDPYSSRSELIENDP